jgi:hypothetical protein
MWGRVTPASGARTVEVQLRRRGPWHTIKRVRLDSGGRFVTRPHLRRGRSFRSAGGHSSLALGFARFPFATPVVKLRAVSKGASPSRTVRVTLAR